MKKPIDYGITESEFYGFLKKVCKPKQVLMPETQEELRVPSSKRRHGLSHLQKRMSNKATKEDLELDREIGPTTILLVQSYLKEGFSAEYIAQDLNRDVDTVEALIALGEKKGWDNLIAHLNRQLRRIPKEGYRK